MVPEKKVRKNFSNVPLTRESLPLSRRIEQSTKLSLLLSSSASFTSERERGTSDERLFPPYSISVHLLFLSAPRCGIRQPGRRQSLISTMRSEPCGESPTSSLIHVTPPLLSFLVVVSPHLRLPILLIPRAKKKKKRQGGGKRDGGTRQEGEKEGGLLHSLPPPRPKERIGARVGRPTGGKFSFSVRGRGGEEFTDIGLFLLF